MPTALVLTTAISEAADICIATSFNGTMLSFYADQTTHKWEERFKIKSTLLLYNIFSLIARIK